MKENYELQTTLRHKNNFIKRQQYRISSLENKTKALQAQLDTATEYTKKTDEQFKLNSDAHLKQVKAMKDQIQELKKKIDVFENGNNTENQDERLVNRSDSLMNMLTQLNKDFLSWAEICPVCKRHRDDILSWIAFGECKHGTCYRCYQSFIAPFRGIHCPVCNNVARSFRELSHDE